MTNEERVRNYGYKIISSGGEVMKFEAFSKEEALKAAAKHFECNESKLDVVILEQPTTKMMGLRKVPGKYNINLIGEHEVKEEVPESRGNGSISVKDGVIRVKDPVGTGAKASVYLRHPQVSLIINGEPQVNVKPVSEEDEITFTFEHVKPSVRTLVTFSDDDLKAYLTVHKEYGKEFSISDLEETFRGELKVEEKVIPPKNPTYRECVDILLDFNVQESLINENALMKAITAEGTTKVLVAMGKEAVESEKTKITYCDEILVKEVSEGLEPVVKTGTLLAKKVGKAREGIPGVDVKGKPINVAKVEDEILEVESGAVLKGDSIFAALDGRPYLKGGLVGVIPLLTMVGDLGKDNDNIKFNGDVVVKGNVMDNMEINAAGNITILGSVYHSTLISDNNVEIKGKIIGGRIRAGDQNAMYKAVLPVVEEMIEEIQLIFQGLKMENGEGVKELMETINKGQIKLTNCLDEGSKLAVMMDDNEVREIESMKQRIGKCFREIKLLNKEGFEKLNEIYSILLDKAEMMRQEVSDERMVKVIYAQNTVISSSGDIIFTGKGSYQSDLSAGHEIKFESMSSVVKGGTLIAGKFIRAGVVGTPNEIETHCQVLDGEGDITGRFYKGTKLMIKNMMKEYLPISN